MKQVREVQAFHRGHVEAEGICVDIPRCREVEDIRTEVTGGTGPLHETERRGKEEGKEQRTGEEQKAEKRKRQ